jgi:hypothetical protein
MRMMARQTLLYVGPAWIFPHRPVSPLDLNFGFILRRSSFFSSTLPAACALGKK